MGGSLDPGRDPAVIAQIVVRAAADATSLSPVRRAVRRHLVAAGAAPDVVADLELAVSELATNVIRHSSTDDIVVGLEQVGSSWMLDVHGAASLDAIAPEIPRVGSVDGRGLVVAAAVTDHLELIDVDGDRIVRCWRAG
ncbi:MAG: ATP-binding protein [Actinomycetota bacterium]